MGKIVFWNVDPCERLITFATLKFESFQPDAVCTVLDS